MTREEAMKKSCSMCGKSKNKKEFGKDRRAYDGLKSHCKTCHNINQKMGRKHGLIGTDREVSRNEFVNWNDDAIYC